MLNSELPLFSNVYLGFINIFSIKQGNPNKKYLSTEQIIERELLKREVGVEWGKGTDYPEAEEEADYAISFSETEKFLFSGEVNHFRRKLNSIFLLWDDSSPFVNSDKTMEIEVFLTVYPNIETANLMFHLKLNHGKVDDIIFLKQLFSRSCKCTMRIEAPAFLPRSNENELSVHEICEEYIKFVKISISKNNNESIYSSNMIEIREIIHNNSPEIQDNYCKDYPQQIYGLLTSDEGWSFVPTDLAQKRIGQSWGSRDFFHIFSHAKTVLMFNYAKSNRRLEYNRMQQALNQNYGRQIEHYFNDLPRIAGVDHGPLIILENVSVMRFLLDSIIPELKSQKDNNKSFFLKRNHLLETLISVSSIGIKELKVLEEMIRDSLNIAADIETVEKRLEYDEGTVNMTYTRSINYLLIGIAFLQVILPLILTAYPSLLETLIKMFK